MRGDFVNPSSSLSWCCDGSSLPPPRFPHLTYFVLWCTQSLLREFFLSLCSLYLFPFYKSQQFTECIAKRERCGRAWTLPLDVLGSTSESELRWVGKWFACRATRCTSYASLNRRRFANAFAANLHSWDRNTHHCHTYLAILVKFGIGLNSWKWRATVLVNYCYSLFLIGSVTDPLNRNRYPYGKENIKSWKCLRTLSTTLI